MSEKNGYEFVTGTWNLCRNCFKWMEHKKVGESMYECVNCGTIVYERV